MMNWLAHQRILLKDYRAFTKDTTLSSCRAIEAPAEQAGLYRYLNNCRDCKEEAPCKEAPSGAARKG